MPPRGAALVFLVALALAGCGNPNATEERRVEKAFRDQIAASKQGDGATYCRKVIWSLSLPREIARKLHAPEQAPGPEPSIPRDIEDCTRHYRAGDETKRRIPRFVVHATLDPPMHPVGGITRTAHVTIVVNGKRSPYRAPFVRYRGDWKMVTPDGG